MTAYILFVLAMVLSTVVGWLLGMFTMLMITQSQYERLEEKVRQYRLLFERSGMSVKYDLDTGDPIVSVPKD